MPHPVKCHGCQRSGRIPVPDLPPMLKGALGVRPTDDCPECSSAAGIHYLFGMVEMA